MTCWTEGLWPLRRAGRLALSSFVSDELCRRLRRNSLKGAHGRLDVADIKLAEQLHGGTAYVIAEALVLRPTSGGQIELGAAPDQAVCL